MKEELEVAADDNNLCGEAPIWDSERFRLLWADIESALVFQLSLPDNRKRIISRGLPVAGIALNQGGGMVFAGATGFHLWNMQEGYATVIREFNDESLVFNDIIADEQGRVYAGTCYWGDAGMEKTGKLYLIDTHGSLRIVDEGIGLSNGLGFSPDNRILYYADSAARRIYSYEVQPKTGDLTNKRNFVKVPLDEGIPDGLTVDAEGFVWSAQWYGGQVVRYDPDGKAARRLDLPVKQVSSVMFGGPELTDLYITTAGRYWPSDLEPAGFDPTAPMGGRLYRIHLDIQGKPEHLARFQIAPRLPPP